MPSEQTDQANIEQWVFKPRSLLVLCWVAVPFFLSIWLVWFAFAWAGRLGWLFGLLSVLCAGIGIAGWKMWQNSRRNTGRDREFIRLDEDGLSYCIHGCGADKVKYAWIRSVYQVHTRGCQGIAVEYRRPETGVVLDTIMLTDLDRLDLGRNGFKLADPHDIITKAIRARCQDRQLYRI